MGAKSYPASTCRLNNFSVRPKGAGIARQSETLIPLVEPLTLGASPISHAGNIMAKPLNVGMIGYGFMGRAHSNAYANVNHFFNLEYRPVLKAVCARNADNAKQFQ